MDFYCFIREFQTLITGLLALFAAIVTAILLWRGQQQTEKHHREGIDKAAEVEKQSRFQKFSAARSVLPLSLSSLCKYAEQAVKFSAAGHTAFSEGQQFSNLPPELPDSIVPTLKELVENGDAEITASTSLLISKIQVHHSRLEDLPRGASVPNIDGGTSLYGPEHFDQGILDSVRLYAHASSFFDYARGETDQPPMAPDNQAILSACNLLRVERGRFPGVFERL